MSRSFSIDAPSYLYGAGLYERKPVTDLWTKLTIVAKLQWKWRATKAHASLHPKKRLLQVYGPPGTGKSSAALAWVSKVCASKDVSVDQYLDVKALWMTCAAKAIECWSISRDDGGDGSGVQIVSRPPPTDDQAKTTAESYDIVVLDGIRESNIEKWRFFCLQLARQGVLVVMVSSEGFRLHIGDANDIKFLKHFVSSWTLDEYLGACESDELWSTCHEYFDNATATDNVEKRKELLRDKYNIAGQSARYMFAFNNSELSEKICEDVEQMGDIKYLEQAAGASRSTGAVNSLIARTLDGANGCTPTYHASFPTLINVNPPQATDAQELRSIGDEVQVTVNRLDARLVSAFATEQVVKKLPKSVATLRSVARSLKNKVIEGYALEEQLKKSL